MTATLEAHEPTTDVRSSTRDTGVRRFAVAVGIGSLVVAVPYLWILTDLWNRSPNLLRTVLPNRSLSNFYDLQARAMFQGHLFLPKGSLGEEAFIHDGRSFTYFGVFPSLLRMPILLFTHSLDGRLTAPSILLSWVVTGTFSALLLWRVRVLVRGPAALGRAEAAGYGVLIATILGGSVLVDLAASPWVYSEDIAWSVALTVGSLFALLGVLEAPSWPRVTGAGVLILCATLNRGSTGYACVLGALLAAAWLGAGRSGRENRRWWWPVLLAGAIPLVVGAAVSMAKFGVPFGLPLHDQVDFNRYLTHIKGSYFSARYVPTTVATYLGVDGVHLSWAFPFITLPLHPAHPVGGVPLFGTQAVTSVPESMPLLLLFALWGLVAAFRRRTVLNTRTTVVPLLAAATPCGAILIFGYLDNRFLGDFVPFLVVGSAIGMVDLWRRLQGSGQRVRAAVVAVLVVLGLFGVVANTAMASTPTGWWSTQQILRFVEFQKSVGDLTGHPLTGYVARGDTLPASAPIGQLFITGNCAGLYAYLPNGVRSWVVLEKGPTSRPEADVTVHGSTAGLGRGVPLFSVAHPATTASMTPDGPAQVRFVLSTGRTVVTSPPVPIEPDRTYRVVAQAHATSASLSATPDGRIIALGSTLIAKGPLAVRVSRGRSAGVTVTAVGSGASDDSLCRSLIH